MCCTRERFCLFFFLSGFILGLFVSASIPGCLFWLVVENVNLFPIPCLLHFPLQSHCFLFWSPKFLPWRLEPFSIHSLLLHYGVLASSWHAAVEIILLACCSGCVNPSLSVSPSSRLVSVFCLAPCLFFLTWHISLHSALFCFSCSVALLMIFILLSSTVKQPIYNAWFSALPPLSPFCTANLFSLATRVECLSMYFCISPSVFILIFFLNLIFLNWLTL